MRALIIVALAAATAACGSATASTDSPAAPPQAQERTPDRFMARGPETRQQIRPGQVTCTKKVPSLPC